MAGNLKGITIEIGASTTKFGTAIKECTTATKRLQTDLTMVNKALKLDPTNVTLLKQKQDILNSSIAETKKKLEVQKAAMEQINSGKLDVPVEEQQKLQRQIVFTEQKLKSLEQEHAQFGNVAGQYLQGVGTKFKDVGSKVEEVGNKMKGVSLAAAAVAGGSIAAAEEIHGGYEKIITATGATGDALADLEQQANDVFGSMNVSMDSVGSAVGEINTRFGLTGDSLEECSKEFLKFADVNNTDVTTAVRNVSRYMGDAGIDTSEYKDVLDNLTLAAQASGISVDTLSESLTKYGAPMRALGFDTKESIAIFSQWEKAGVNTEIAFSGMKKAIGNWSAEGKDAREEFGKTLQQIKDAPDIADATSIAIEAFGQKAGPDLADAIQNGRFEYQDFLDLLSSSDGTLDTTFENTQTGVDKAKTALNNLKLAAADLGETIMSTLAPIIEQLSGAIQAFSQWFGQLDPGVKQAIATILLVVAALAPLLIGLGSLISAIGSIVSFIGTLVSAMSTVAAAVSGAVALPVLIVAAVVAAIAVLYATCEPFRDFINGVIDAIVGFFTNLGATVVQIVTVDIPNAINAFISFFTTTLPSAISSGIAAILGWFASLPGNIAGAISGAIGVVAGWCSEMLSTAVSGVSQVASGIVDTLASLPGQMVSIGSNIVEGLWNGISDMTGWVIGKIQGFGDDVLGGLKDFFGIHSPSTVMRDQIGKFIPAGIGVGIEKNADFALDAMKDLSNDMLGVDFNAGDVTRKIDAQVLSSNRSMVKETAYDDSRVVAAIGALGERISAMELVLDTGTVAGAVTDKVDRNLGKTRRKAVAYA